MPRLKNSVFALLLVAATFMGAPSAFAQDTAAADQTREEIEAAMGGLPSFVKTVSDGALPG